MSSLKHLLFATIFISTQVFADDERTFVSLELRTPTHVASTSFVADDLYSTQLGKSKNYLTTTCSGNARGLGSIGLFEGEIVTVRRHDKAISLRVEEHQVISKDKEIATLPEETCISLVPEQRVTFSKDIEFPSTPTPSSVIIDLGAGYSIRYSVINARL